MHRVQAQLVLLGHELVVAVAEEREVVVLEPSEEGACFLDLLGVEPGRRRLAELGRQAERTLAHQRPVVDGRADLADHTHQLAAQLLEPRRVGLAVHLGVDDRLADRVLLVGAALEHLDQLSVRIPADVHHRVDDLMDAEALAVQLHRDRVDQERLVVGHDLDGGVRRAPAVRLEHGVVDAHLGLAGPAAAREAELAHGQPVEVEGVAVDDVVGRHPAVELPDEGLRVRCAVVSQKLADARANLFYQRFVGVLDTHRAPSSGVTIESMPAQAAGKRLNSLLR